MRKQNIIKRIRSGSKVLIAAMGFALMAFTPIENSQSASSFEYRALGNQAFGYNEELSFRVHYGFINAAVIDMKVGSSPVLVNNRNTYYIKAEGKTISTFDWMFKVRDKFETYIDQDALAPQKYQKAVIEDNYKDTDVVIFKHEDKNLYSSKAKGKLTMPEYTQDIVSALYYARNLDFANATKGKEFPLSIYLDEEIYNLKFKYDGKETIKTDVGKVKCIRLVPKLVVDRVFKNEDDMTIWVSDDANKIPIRVKAKIAVGSLKVDLTSYKNLRNPFTALQ